MTLTEKIQALLAAAADTCNQHEAETALKKAVELSIKYDIDISALKNDDYLKDEVTQEAKEVGQRMPICQRYVCSIIQKFFKCEIVYTGNRAMGRNVVFIGKKHDIETAKRLNDYLISTFMSAWYMYKMRTDAPLSHREGYLLGVYNGLKSKLQDAKNSMEASITGDAKNNYAMVVSNNESLLATAMKKYFPNLKYTTPKRISYFANSYNAGVQDGKTIRIHDELRVNPLALGA